jgi:transcriptional regulator NrdR family protein
MNCPECGAPSIVTDTRLVEGQRHRRRKCPKNHKFYTNEVAIEKWAYVDPRIARNKPKKPKPLLPEKGAPEWVKKIWEKLSE